MSKKFLTLAALVFAFAGARAQEAPLLNQYHLNGLYLNPAVAGSADYVPFRFSLRQQWRGFTDAPATYAVSGHYRLSKATLRRNIYNMSGHGIGATLFSDNKGAMRNAGAQAAYAFHTPLFENVQLGIGASATFSQFNIDQASLFLATGGDPVLGGENFRRTIFDADFGVYLYSTHAERDNDFYLGLSGNQLMRPSVTFDETSYGDDRMARVVAINAGYELFDRAYFKIEPGFLYGARLATDGLENVIHLNLRASLMHTLRTFEQEEIQLLFSYRVDEGLVSGVNFLLESIYVGYCYEYSFSDIMTYNNGSHQVVLGYNWKP